MASEIEVRERARRQYRDEGLTRCPYPKGSKEWRVWLDESRKILKEYLRSI